MQESNSPDMGTALHTRVQVQHYASNSIFRCSPHWWQGRLQLKHSAHMPRQHAQRPASRVTAADTCCAKWAEPCGLAVQPAHQRLRPWDRRSALPQETKWYHHPNFRSTPLLSQNCGASLGLKIMSCAPRACLNSTHEIYYIFSKPSILQYPILTHTQLLFLTETNRCWSSQWGSILDPQDLHQIHLLSQHVSSPEVEFTGRAHTKINLLLKP